MSQFGYGIIPQLFQSGLGYSGQATSLNQSWTNAALQNSAQQAALAEARRRALEQEKIQREQIDAQKDAQKDAQTSQWINMGIGAGTGAAAGGILGGLAAAPAGAALGGTAPAAAASAPPIMSPTGIATTQAAAAGPMSQGVPFTGSIGMPDPRLSGGGGIGGMSPPQFQPFAPWLFTGSGELLASSGTKDKSSSASRTMTIFVGAKAVVSGLLRTS